MMVNYAKLADQAKVIQDTDRLATEEHMKPRPDPCAFFERVRACILEEMFKANFELHKHGADGIEQNHLPGFSEEIFLTYGTGSLCRVRLGIRNGECRVTAVISGPPNGHMLSQKEYFCNQYGSCQEHLHTGRERLQAGSSLPDKIAGNIISGILMGKFD